MRTSPAAGTPAAVNVVYSAASTPVSIPALTVGFDLGELLIGDVLLGERSADCLPALDARCLPA